MIIWLLIYFLFCMLCPRLMWRPFVHFAIGAVFFSEMMEYRLSRVSCFYCFLVRYSSFFFVYLGKIYMFNYINIVASKVAVMYGCVCGEESCTDSFLTLVSFACIITHSTPFVFSNYLGRMARQAVSGHWNVTYRAMSRWVTFVCCL